MYRQKVASAIAELREAAAQAAWTQWAAIFSFPASKRRAHAIVDPEALLLGSLTLSEHEPRLRGVVQLWARYESRLLSVQRVKGRSCRSKPLKQRDRQATPVLEGDPPLMLRLRLGIGVGIKPDVIAYLIGVAGGRQPVLLIAKATAYHGRAVRRALEELAAAGFVEARPTAPISYRADVPKWGKLLAIDPDDPPAWRSWAAMYGFVAALMEWSQRLPAESDVVLASEARDIMSEYGVMLDGAVRLPRMDQYRGEAFLEPFMDGLKACVEYLEAVV